MIDKYINDGYMMDSFVVEIDKEREREERKKRKKLWRNLNPVFA